MNIDFAGVMTVFAAVRPGDFFIYFEDDGPAFGMKISLPDKTVAVISFSAAVHAGVTPPTMLEGNQFQNSTVCVLPNAVIRPPSDPDDLRKNSPSLNSPGPIIVGVGGTFIRAHAPSGTIDVDLTSGAAERFRAHHGSVWVDDWEIVLPLASGEIRKLRERGKPASTRA